MNRTASNEQLAQEYFRSVTQCASDWRTYLAVRRAIRESPVDLRAYFNEHGSFRRCKVPGIGKKTYELLERILREGLATVAADIVERREDAMRPKPGIPAEDGGVQADEAETGEMHNAIRAIEECRG